LACRGRGELDEALRVFSDLVEISPDYAEAHFQRGALLEKMKRNEDAAASYRAALKAQPGYEDALWALDRVAPGKSGATKSPNQPK
ncbi:tetratricopeptide repeat protein, partial [Myxococcota bacterium]|nr:tetratricopeptide repeat protein [Myxococcota bacterium]